MSFRSCALFLFLWASVGCLDPLTDDAVPLDRLIEPPGTDGPFIEDIPEMASRVAQFTQQARYVQGFAEGNSVRYWSVDGITATFIAPVYVLVDANGNNIDHRPIIDVIPPDAGYTPFWRRTTLVVTSQYQGEVFRSREAMDAGVEAGLLEAPVPSTQVRSCPVVPRDLEIEVTVEMPPIAPTWVWYRGMKVHWLNFSAPAQVPINRQDMPTAPVFMLQRINETVPLNETIVGADLDGDQRIDASNNIFSMGVGSPSYTPLWFAVYVRTREDYISFDSATSTASIQLTAAEQFARSPNGYENDPLLNEDQDIALSLDVRQDTLINCPIQPTEGAL